jgi:diguanylate cyclase (GGDEF)-like protein
MGAMTSDRRATARRATARLFAVYAIVSVIPILALGLVLASHFRQEAQQRGIDQARAEAQLVAQTAIEPLLHGAPLSDGLSAGERADLQRLVRRSINHHGQGALRLRLRNLSGHVVFSDDGTGFNEPVDDEAVDAAAGRTVAGLTSLNADAGGDDDLGQRAVEVYLPLNVGTPAHRVGVMELYLSYAPIRAEVTSLLRTLYRDLVIGLGLLYLALFAITVSVSRKLLRHAELNAHLAEYDTLTGLPNRSLFQRQAAAALATRQRQGERVAIAIVELDRFKDINDTLGHRNGDEVLTQLACRLSAGAQGVDGMTVARLGGDEFGLVLPCGPDPGAELTAVRHALEGELTVAGLTLSVQASIGYALAPVDGDDVDTLMQRADVAMYVAKAEHAGVARYEAEDDQYDAASLGLVSELRQAIEQDQLVLHYQPQRDVLSGRTSAVEALVRWQHPTRGLLYPDTFLPLAEQTDLIDRLTRWVLRRALSDLRGLGQAGSRLTVAVNVSARGIGRGELADDVIEALTEQSMPGERLVIEVTETAILADPTRAAIELRRLAAAGVKISLDDFGQGQTSLGHLSALPLDELKIDRAFVGNMLSRPTDRAIVHSIVDLGHNLGLRVVAEGVETDAVLDELSGRGCDLVQGYLLSRPLTLEALSQWLARAPRVPKDDASPRVPKDDASPRVPKDDGARREAITA